MLVYISLVNQGLVGLSENRGSIYSVLFVDLTRKVEDATSFLERLISVAADYFLELGSQKSVNRIIFKRGEHHR